MKFLERVIKKKKLKMVDILHFERGDDTPYRIEKKMVSSASLCTIMFSILSIVLSHIYIFRCRHFTIFKEIFSNSTHFDLFEI